MPCAHSDWHLVLNLLLVLLTAMGHPFFLNSLCYYSRPEFHADPLLKNVGPIKQKRTAWGNGKVYCVSWMKSKDYAEGLYSLRLFYIGRHDKFIWGRTQNLWNHQSQTYLCYCLQTGLKIRYLAIGCGAIFMVNLISIVTVLLHSNVSNVLPLYVWHSRNQ